MSVAQKLIALDEDDLAVISAHVQDATVRVPDIIWRHGEKRLIVVVNRCDGGTLGCGGPTRRLAALRFDRVLACKSRHIDLDAPDLVIELLGLEFHPGEAPGGSVVLFFTDRGEMRIDIECIECELADLGDEDESVAEDGIAAVDAGARIA